MGGLLDAAIDTFDVKRREEGNPPKRRPPKNISGEITIRQAGRFGQARLQTISSNLSSHALRNVFADSNERYPDGETMKVWMKVGMAGALLCFGVGSKAQTTDSLGPSVCAQENGVSQCNWAAFKRTFSMANTVVIQTQPMDQRTEAQVSKVVTQLGKTVISSAEGTSDLTFLIIPLNKTGVYIGPADEDLATLRIYTGRTKTERGALVWTETYRGKPDIPWPSVVYYTLNQFQDRLKHQ